MIAEELLCSLMENDKIQNMGDLMECHNTLAAQRNDLAVDSGSHQACDHQSRWLSLELLMSPTWAFTW